jgi:hypothetical protein
MSFANLKWKHVPRYTKKSHHKSSGLFSMVRHSRYVKNYFFFKEERSVQLIERTNRTAV